LRIVIRGCLGPEFLDYFVVMDDDIESVRVARQSPWRSPPHFWDGR